MRTVAPILLDGQWITPRSKVLRPILNPATMEPLGLAADCTREDVHFACEAAARAQPGWWAIPGVEKAKLLREVGARIRAADKELATLMARESGKPLIEAIDEIEWVAAAFEYYAEVGRRSFGNSIPPVAPHQVNFTIKEPFGVVAAIVPFNFPLLLLAWKLAPALAAGNTVVAKPPHQNPLSTLLMAKCFADLPAGVVNVITGGREAGELLVQDPKVDLIAFTGSLEAGRAVAAEAGRQLKKVNLELGSVDPFIVFADANLDIAVPGVAWARLLNAGQVCTSSKRVYVVREIAAEFTRRLHAYVQGLVVGDPMDPATDVGPLITADALARVEDQVQAAIEEGATLLHGGRRLQPNGLEGHFYEPTILTNVRHGGLPTREEIFGPVLSITVADDAEQAITMANDSRFGLGASIYTNSLELAMTAMHRIKAGTFWINDPLTDNDAGPFGGMRLSGIGRELGEEGLDAFREPKHVHMDYVMEAKPWWFPYKSRPIPGR